MIKYYRFHVENTSDNGISMGEEEHKLGIRVLHTSSFLYETKVPVENMLSERGNGFKIAMNALNVGRIKLASFDAQRRVISAVQYANERIQFNTAIAQFCSSF
jgi:alkylation response protein AidB-like acyl-CoA dehydrogenase